MSFEQFYQDGGFFMHVITVLGAVATGALVRLVIERRLALARGTTVAPPGSLVPRLALVTVLVGLLALVDGTMQLMNALRTVSVDQWIHALARGGGLVLIPFGWALGVASTLLFADTMLLRRRPPA